MGSNFSRREWLGFVLLFSVSLCHFIQKPFRDDVAAQIGVDNLNVLMTGTFAVSIVLAFILFFCREIKLLLPILLCSNSFFLLYQFNNSEPSFTALIIYFVLTSTCNLSIISLTTGKIMKSMPLTSQSNELTRFGIAPTLAAILGPLFCLSINNDFNTFVLVIASGISLIGAILAWMAERSAYDIERAETREPEGNTNMPTLILYTFLYSLISTFFYYLLLREIAGFFSPEHRIKAFALAELASNLLGISTALMIQGSGRHSKSWVLLPFLSLIILAALGINPIASLSIALIIFFKIFKNGVRVQAKDIALFYIAPTAFIPLKNMMDTVIYRSGDMAGGWLLLWIKGSKQTIVLSAIPIVLLWIAVGSRLQKNINTSFK